MSSLFCLFSTPLFLGAAEFGKSDVDRGLPGGHHRGRLERSDCSAHELLLRLWNDGRNGTDGDGEGIEPLVHTSSRRRA